MNLTINKIELQYVCGVFSYHFSLPLTTLLLSGNNNNVVTLTLSRIPLLTVFTVAYWKQYSILLPCFS